MIHIEERPYAVNEFFAGVYEHKTAWEDEVEITDYPFTVETIWEDNIFQIVTVNHITWTETIPPNWKLVEEHITANFGELISEDE
jgi:hypothetical protein